eukprot:SAG22_NODE_1612_length_3998_cov_12.441652_3_plen_161_part_00
MPLPSSVIRWFQSHYRGMLIRRRTKHKKALAAAETALALAAAALKKDKPEPAYEGFLEAVRQYDYCLGANNSRLGAGTAGRPFSISILFRHLLSLSLPFSGCVVFFPVRRDQLPSSRSRHTIRWQVSKHMWLPLLADTVRVEPVTTEYLQVRVRPASTRE